MSAAVPRVLVLRPRLEAETLVAVGHARLCGSPQVAGAWRLPDCIVCPCTGGGPAALARLPTFAVLAWLTAADFGAVCPAAAGLVLSPPPPFSFPAGSAGPHPGPKPLHATGGIELEPSGTPEPVTLTHSGAADPHSGRLCS